MIKKTIISFIILCAIAISSAYYLVMHNMAQEIKIPSQELITIEKGMTINSFSRLLVDKGWINSRLWLKVYVKLKPEFTSIKKGTYLIPAGINTIDLLALLVEGKEHHYLITFIEGSTFKEWLIVLKNNTNLIHDVSSLTVENITKKLNIKQSNPEGLFFPDTYAFTVGTTELDILKRAHKKMNEQLNFLWDNRAENLPYNTSYESLIMASIIEKESGVHSEQPIISSVFVNRLYKNMRLQTDPTVIYGLGERYKGDIKRSHLKEKTAYNTYRIDGMPPTPIAMPGLLALKAAMNPSSTDYLYFVSDGNGQHVFSQTLNEHNKAVADYLKATKNK